MPINPVLESLTKASEGLLFPSETDAELVPFLWEAAAAPTSERLRAQAGATSNTAVEKTTLADLLRAVPNEDRAKFRALEVTLEAHLSAIQVYKVGDEPEKTVWIVGETVDGHWAGLKTTVVET